MEIVIDGAGASYAPVGACIYCGAVGELTKEHIIPSGLGGNHTLPHASCKECQKKICRVENHCLRKMLGSLRVRLGLSGTVPAGTFPLNIINSEGQVEVVQINPGDYPRMLALARWPEPGILVGRAPTADFGWRPWFKVWETDRDQMQSKFGGMGYQSPEVEPNILCQMLAKIGLSAAAAIVRPKNYDPLVQDLILNDSKTPFYFVGGGFAEHEVPTEEENVAHWVSLGWERKFLVASIRLFAFLGTPVYRVAVGYSENPNGSTGDKIAIPFRLAAASSSNTA